MASLEEDLQHEINWRTSELSIIKTVPFLYNMSEAQKAAIKKHTIPAIYSLWEGFVRSALNIYIKEINVFGLSVDKLCKAIVISSFDKEFADIQQGFQKKVKLVEGFYYHLANPLTIPTIGQCPNINYKRANKLLMNLGLEKLPENKKHLEQGLDQLLKRRNNIAHGDCGESHTPTDDDIAKLSSTLLNSMDEVYSSIISGYTEKSFTVDTLKKVACY